LPTYVFKPAMAAGRPRLSAARLTPPINAVDPFECSLGLYDRDTMSAECARRAEVWESAGMKGAGRRRPRQPGAVVLALLLGTAAMALALTLYYHLGVPGAVVTFLLGLPGLYLGWGGLQDARRPPDRSLAQIADELAARLRSQWADEAEARGLNDPYPLPVAWTAANAPLAGDLDALKTLADSGAGWSAPAQENWAKGPDDLVGGGKRKLADVLATVPTGRLMVLGEPGAGKTMLMVGLVLDLLHPGRRSSGDPVPVLASLASWDPVSQDLHGWLGAMLITGYPDLAAAAPPGSAGDNRCEALVEAGLILPVLDGLDEISEAARPTAITRINKELKPGEQVVVTCRTEQYRAAVSPQDGQGASLRAAAVQLSTLGFDEVTRYLREDAGPAAEGRWDFLDTLSPKSPMRQVLVTPLMAGLARAIYNPRPDERTKDLRHPAELCDFADRAEVEAHLFEAFIPAAYQPPTGGRWTARQAETWLVFLARHLEQTIRSPDLAGWQLQKARQGTAFRFTVGVAAMLASGLVMGLVIWRTPRGGPVLGLQFGLGIGLGGGLMLGLAVAFAGAGAPARRMRISVSVLAAALAFGLVMGLVIWRAPKGGLMPGLGVFLLCGLGGGLMLGLAGVPGDPAGATSPRAVLARDRQLALRLILTPGLAVGLVFGLALGLALGLAVGFLISVHQTAWPSYMLTREWLALRHRLPWSLMSFLADAHQRGVLRQAGAVYQFRHIELQHRLATRPETRSRLARRPRPHAPPAQEPAE